MNIPFTPKSSSKSKCPTSTPKSCEGIDSYSIFAETIGLALSEASSESSPEVTLAELVYQVGLDAVERRRPSPEELVCHWLPRSLHDFGLDAKALRKAIRQRCIRSEVLRMPESEADNIVSDPTRRRRRLRDAELQILLRVLSPSLGKKTEACVKRREERAITALFESASFQLMAPHLDCESSTKHTTSPIVEDGRYESFRSFFLGLAPKLRRKAPNTLKRLITAFEFDDQDAATPVTLASPSAHIDINDDKTLVFPTVKSITQHQKIKPIAHKQAQQPKDKPMPSSTQRELMSSSLSAKQKVPPRPLLTNKRSNSALITATSKRSCALSLSRTRPQRPEPSRPQQQPQNIQAAQRQFRLGVLSPSPPRNRATKATKRSRQSTEEDSSPRQSERPLPRPRVLSIASPSPKRRVVIAETPVDKSNFI